MKDQKLRYQIGKGGVNRLLSLLVLGGLIALSACTTGNRSKVPAEQQYQGKTMGTTFHLTTLGDAEIPSHGVDSILDLLNTVFSTYDTASFISYMNNGVLDAWRSSKGEDMYKVCESHFAKVYGMSQGVYLRTNGAFDPSGAPLFNLWGFAESERRIPSIEELDSIMNFVGLAKFYFERREFTNPLPGFTLNFNAIAKGYAVDVVSMFLMVSGYSDFMVEIGGEVFALGHNAQGGDWVIGINEPSIGSEANSLIDTVHVSGGSVATSGNYRNYYKDSTGRVIGHTIDPRTGRPAMSDLLSVSIKHPSCAIADAYATAAMTAGSEPLLSWVSSDSLLKAVIVRDSSGSSVVSRLGH